MTCVFKNIAEHYAQVGKGSLLIYSIVVETERENIVPAQRPVGVFENFPNSCFFQKISKLSENFMNMKCLSFVWTLIDNFSREI